jgi:ParB-like nuclease domain
MNDTPDMANAVKPATDVDNTTDNFEPPNWREVLRVHPAAELFPLMKETDPEGFRELVEDIKQHGLRQPITLYHDAELGVCLLDGRNRLDALEQLGWQAGDEVFEPPSGEFWMPDAREMLGGDPTFDPFGFTLSANVHRRHLTAEQRRDLIARLLKATPEKSNRQIGSEIGATHVTVGAVLRELESTGQIDRLAKTTGKDGKARPARRHAPDPVPPELKSPGIVVPLKRPASKPMTPDQFMDRALPTLDVYCSALTEIAKSDPAGARDCAAKMHAAIDEAIEAAHDDHPTALQ